MSDLISRQDAIDIVTFECGEWQGIANRINEQIQRLPSAQQEIVRCIEALKEQKTGECIPSKAVKIFTEAYRKTQTRLYVKKPMSYAFYEVWKYYDRHEKPRW